MTPTETTYLGHPAHRVTEDEGLHAPPPEAEGGLWGDTVWLSGIDPDAGIWGLNHMHICPNRGFGRFHGYYSIDGVEQVYFGKQVGGLEYGDMSWTDGKMSYEVIEPYERIRLTLDHTEFGFDFTYTARHPIFDYDDCIGGNPLEGLKPAAGIHGGHYEQALDLKGTFEIRGGPSEGEVREIDTLAHRDHTWSDRFTGEGPWSWPEGTEAGLHFWLVCQFPERGLNVTGFFDLSPLGIERRIDQVGGFESSARGVRRVAGGGAAPVDGGLAEPRGDQCPLRWRVELEGGQTIHISMPEPVWVCKLRMLGEDDAESRLNDYETYGEMVIEETGERGFGQFEHSTLPPEPPVPEVSEGKGPWGWLTATFPAAKPGGITWRVQNLATGTHNWIFRKSRGRFLGNFDGAPLCVLRTRGAKSGELRESPVIYLADRDRMVMVGSIGGNPKNPAWYHNLKANPDCEVDVAGGRRSMRARQASEAEADELWPRLLEMWPAWGDYMKRTDRTFPVMILEPRES